MFDVTLEFHGGLGCFLAREFRAESIVRRRLGEKTAVKDVIEACGVPHPEIDLIIAHFEAGGDAQSVRFEWQVEQAVRLEVYPVPAPAELFASVPRLQQRQCARFVVDGHLGKLARDLRLLGLDAAYERDADDRRLLEIMKAENRALLTCDRRLLMHSAVREGYCPRSSNPVVQTGEVLSRFALRGSAFIRPYSRCLRCNGRLQNVAKDDVLEPLAGEPRTLRYYDAFRRCESCGQIYWPGTHFDKLHVRVNVLLPE